MSSTKKDEDMFLKNLNFYIENKRYYDAIQILNNLEINKENFKIPFTEKSEIKDIINKLDENKANLKDIEDYFRNETLDSSEIYFLQQQMNLENLDKNSTLIYDLLTKPKLYSKLLEGLENLKNKIEILNDIKLNNI